MYIYPIKGLRPTQLREATLTRHGFPYDRRFMILKINQSPDGTRSEPESESQSLQKMQVSSHPEMTLFFTEMVLPENQSQGGGKIIVTYRPRGTHDNDSEGVKKLEIPLQPDVSGLKEVEINLHNSPTTAYDMGPEFDDWFSACFGYRVVLVYLGGYSRAVLGSLAPGKSPLHGVPRATGTATGTGIWKEFLCGPVAAVAGVAFTFYLLNAYGYAGLGYGHLLMTTLVSVAFWAWQSRRDIYASLRLAKGGKEERITFSDHAAYLVVSETSLQNVSDRLKDGDMDITKFRPNIVLSGAETPFEEDFWAVLRIGSKEEKRQARLLLTANCGRCQSINVDFSTGKFGTGESGTVLKKLMGDRRVDRGSKWSPIFGRYGFLDRASGLGGVGVRVGDEVIVERRADSRTVFGRSMVLFAWLDCVADSVDWPGLST